MYESLFPVLQIGYGQMGKWYLPLMLKAGIPADQIVVVDSNPEVLLELMRRHPDVRVTPLLRDALSMSPQTAFVLTNSPTHLGILQSLCNTTVKHVLVEKPTVLACQRQEFKALFGVFKTFATGFVINFSPALQELLDFMNNEQLYLHQGSARWQKDRSADSRPTAGDVEDELVHPAEALLMLLRQRGGVKAVSVRASVDHIPYVNEEVQVAAHAKDGSFPAKPPSNAMVVLKVDQESRGSVRLFLQSSFVGFDQDRRIEVLLGGFNGKPTHKAQILFDTPEGDVLSIAPMGGQTTSRSVLPAKEKLGSMVVAFLNAAAGHSRDGRLTDFRASERSVTLTNLVNNAATGS